MSHLMPDSSTAPSLSKSNPETHQEAIDQAKSDSDVMMTETGDTEIKDPGADAELSNAEPEKARNTKGENEASNGVQGGERLPEAEHKADGGGKGRPDQDHSQEHDSRSMTKGVKQDDKVEVAEGKENRERLGEKEEEEEEEEETMDPSEIPENLYVALQAIEDSGTFATSGNFPSAPNPTLSIDGIGTVGLPLSSRDAEAIIAAAAQAPFGHGERTVVDTNVRDTWELKPNQVQFLNPAWKDWIEKEVLVKAADDLGITNAAQTVRCELHKVLLYKEGGHFLPHKDTEKAPSMFGTLMVVLPSFYAGGALQLSHSGMQKKFDFGGPASIINTSYAAWYTDILHSVSPVSSGYRLALSYKMIHKGPAVPHLPNTQAQIEELQWVLRTWNRNLDDFDSPKLVGFMLEHEYSEQALNNQKIGALKGADKCRGLALLDLAKELGFEIYLAQMEYQKTGTVLDDGYYGCGGPGRRQRYGYGYGDSDDDHEDKVMDDIIDESLTAKNFINCKTGDALSQDFTPSFEPEDCLPAGYWDEEEPNTKNYEGYTGNEDATLDYWYKRTVIILWPTGIHIKSVSRLTHSWDAAVFLDRPLWTQAEIDQGKRLRFGEDIIMQLAASSIVTPGYAHGAYRPRGLLPKEQRYADKLMEFALEEKRLNLFLEVVGLTQSTDIARMTQAAGIFGADGVRDIVQRCISNTKGVVNQLRAAIQFYHQQPDELKIIVKRLIDAVSISKEIKSESFKGLLDLMGPELFQSCILPNLKKDFSNTAFWISLWQQYPVVGWVNDTLPEVVHAHEAQIHLRKDAGHFSISTNTLSLFYKVLETGRADLARVIIQKIQAIPKPANAESGRLKGRFTSALMAIVKQVMQALQRHNIPATTEPYASFIKNIFVDRILPTLGPRPRSGQDFSLQTMREVGKPPCCPNCSAVDIFLSDPWQQTVSYNLNYPLREHLEQKLRGKKHIGVRNDPLPSRIYNRRNTVLGTITINKVGLSAADIIDKWDRARAKIERNFIAIGDEQARKEVFGSLFPIIQMAIRDYGMGWGKKMKEAIVLGEQEEKQIQERRLQDHARIVASTANHHHPRSGSSSENNGRPLAPLGETDDANGSGDAQTTNEGRKRKRPRHVIDLTDE